MSPREGHPRERARGAERGDDARLADASVPALLDEVVASARALWTEEVALLMDEAEAELATVRRACALGVVAAFALSVGLSWAGLALVMALELGALGAGALAVSGLAGGGVLLWLAQRSLPVRVLATTRTRLERRLLQANEVLR